MLLAKENILYVTHVAYKPECKMKSEKCKSCGHIENIHECESNNWVCSECFENQTPLCPLCHGDLMVVEGIAISFNGVCKSCCRNCYIVWRDVVIPKEQDKAYGKGG